MSRCLTFLLILLSTLTARATTWNEPWMDSVIIHSDAFVLAHILSTSESEVRIQVLKNVRGKLLPDSVTISDFHMLQICSESGHGPEFRFQTGDTLYFYLKQDKKGHCLLPTPTAGYDYIRGPMVAATFRHSYHKGPIPRADYEVLMGAIFDHYHNKAYDAAPVKAFIADKLSKAPAKLNEEEMNLFFLQHAALETIYHLKLDGYSEYAMKFLQDTTTWHNQISGARALRASSSMAAYQALMNVVADTGRSPFVQVMCLESMYQLRSKELKPQLRAALPHASGEGNSFGGNLMDPRICTSLPSVKEAIARVLKELE